MDTGEETDSDQESIVSDANMDDKREKSKGGNQGNSDDSINEGDMLLVKHAMGKAFKCYVDKVQKAVQHEVHEKGTTRA